MMRFQNFYVSILLFCYYLIISRAKTSSINMAMTMSAGKTVNLCSVFKFLNNVHFSLDSTKIDAFFIFGSSFILHSFLHSATITVWK